MATRAFTSALFTSIAQAIAVRESMQPEVHPFIKPETWEFMQVWQDRNAVHTCSTAHERMKSTPAFNLNTLHLIDVPDTEPLQEEIVVEKVITSPGDDLPEIEEPVPIPALGLDPSLFEEIVIEKVPFAGDQQECGEEPYKDFKYARSRTVRSR